jgi:SAM-dependent methyltransferase
LWPLLAAVFALSAAGLAFEVSLTRIFSLLFQYHYVFLTVSLAVLGLGLGAALGYLALRGRWVEGGWNDLTWLTLILAPLFPVAAFFLSRVRSAASVWPAAVIGLIPFLLLGLFNALVYDRFAGQGALLYGADLLGAAAGLALSVGLLGWGGGFNAVIALGGLVGLGALALALLSPSFYAGRIPLWGRVAGGIIPLLALGLLLWNRSAGLIEFSPLEVRDASPDKTMLRVLQDPTSEARLVESRWTPFSRVDLVETNDPTAMLVFIDAGAGSYMLRYGPQADNPDWLRPTIEFLPFAAGPTQDTLILGAGAGKDVVMALLARAERITAVEINPAMFAVTRHYADYNGSVLDLPQVEAVVTDGRNFLERSRQQYDLIYLNLVYSQAAEPETAALTENYIFTREALRSYWRHLKPGGRVGFVTHNALGGVRLMMTALSALEQEGLTTQEALGRVALVFRPAPDPRERAAMLLVTKAAWTQEDGERLRNTATGIGLNVLYAPVVAEELVQPLVEGEVTLDEYVAANPEWDIWPTTDDRPFFYDLDPGLPAPLVTLWWFVAPVTAVYLGLTLVARAVSHSNSQADSQGWRFFVPYFALLGVAFMLAEIPLIQRFALLLGNPTLSLIVVLGGLLLGGGLGSLFSNRFAPARLPRLIAIVALAGGVWLALSVLLYPWLIGLALAASLGVRIAVALLLMAVVGLLMGVPFPSGLLLVNASDPAGAPAYWGLNAVTSVLGSAAAMTLANLAGFRWVQLLGAGLYLLVALLTWLAGRRLAIAGAITEGA